MKIKVIKNKNICDFKSWPIWTCEESKFDWQYEQEEHCYIINGNVTISTSDGKVNIGEGDYVIFPEGLKCIWEVHKAIKKHYFFK